MIASKLHSSVSSACPIYGVSVGDENDRTTWKYHPMEEASETQKQSAESVIKSFVYIAPTKDEIASADPVLKMVGAAILEAVFDMKANPANYPTAASLKQKALELYKAKL